MRALVVIGFVVAQAIAVPGVTLLEGGAPFIPGLILCLCVWGMTSQRRSTPTMSADEPHLDR
jgi:hypothetical protein